MTTCSCCDNLLQAFGVTLRDHIVIMRHGAPEILRVCERHRSGPGYRVHHGDGKAWALLVDMRVKAWPVRLFRYLFSTTDPAPTNR